MKDKVKELFPAELYCPLVQAIRLLGKRWTILLVKELYFTKGRRMAFMELKRSLETISTKVLSERLKEMAEDGLIDRQVDSKAKPVRVYYKLTKKGEDVCHIVKEFREYGLKWGGDKTFDCGYLDCEVCTANKRESMK